MPRELEHLPRHVTNHIQQSCECPLLALSGHGIVARQCPLSGELRTSFPGSLAIFTKIRRAHCTSHAFGFSGGSPHSHLPVYEL
jgi:hypothetical protein